MHVGSIQSADSEHRKVAVCADFAGRGPGREGVEFCVFIIPDKISVLNTEIAAFCIRGRGASKFTARQSVYSLQN